MAKKNKVSVKINGNYSEPVAHIIVGEYEPYSNEGIHVKVSDAKRIRKAIKRAVKAYEAERAARVEVADAQR